jgi:DNA invertase Pin-like site-specific DNA recombinase
MQIERKEPDMREVISTVYELADLGVTIVAVKSQTGPINTAMGRKLWAIQSWYAEMENEERSENVRLGQARARAQGKEIGRPREVVNEMEQRILALRAIGHGYKAISQTTGVPRSTVRRILKGAKSMPKTEPLNPVPSIAEDVVL